MKVFETLKMLGLSSEATREVYSENVRDVSPLTVYRDSRSGVIFIDDFYVGDDTYSGGSYRPEKYADSFEAKLDCQRRSDTYRKLYSGYEILDFGCGAGDFLRAVKEDCSSVTGLELQESFIKKLTADGIPCYAGLNSIEEKSFDAIFLFHVLEHLPDPIASLLQIKSKIRSGGKIVIEVPHANDFLLNVAENTAFKEFTLWSQHLILNTRGSLKVFLEYCGFKDVVIEGVQRYPLSNHLQWLSKGVAGGHRSKLSMLDSDELHSAYTAALERIDCTDTLVAVAYI